MNRIFLKHCQSLLHKFLSRILLCIGLVAVLALPNLITQAGTHATIIKGEITTDTVWTEANSPYQINIDVKVNKGVTLSIEPGVVIENSYIWQSTAYNFTVEGRLLALGTAEKPIRFNPGPDGWSGIKIVGEPGAVNAGSILEHVILEGGGSGAAGSGGNLALAFAEATVRHCQFNNGPGDGILGDDGDALGVAHVSDSSFTHNAGYAINFQDGSVNPLLSNLTASGNGYDDGSGNPLPYGGDLVFLAGMDVLHGEHTWENMGLPYLIDQLSVGSDAVLTIEPGVQVLAAPRNDGLDVQGRLVAVGSAGKEIHLDPADPAAGWSGLRILGTPEQPSQGNLLDHVILPKGGYGNDCNLYIERGTATVRNSQFSSGRTSGVCLGLEASLVMTHTQLTNNLQYAMEVREPNAQFALSDLSASGNLTDSIGIGGGTIFTSHTFSQSGIDTYDVYGDLIVDPQAVLSLDPGTRLRFQYGRGLTIHGQWIAEGTPQKPITVTSEVASPGSWAGLAFVGTPAQPAMGRFAYATLEYAGYGGYAMVEVADGKVSFDHCTLRHASSDAIRILGAATGRMQAGGQNAAAMAQVSWTSLLDLGGYGVNNLSAQAVQATYNWWGAASGPLADSNPQGSGSAVNGPVNYRPYLNTPNGFTLSLPIVVR